jgi:hypothetical protein
MFWKGCRCDLARARKRRAARDSVPTIRSNRRAGMGVAQKRTVRARPGRDDDDVSARAVLRRRLCPADVALEVRGGRNRLRKRDAQLFLPLGSALRDLPRRDGRFVLSSVCSASRAAPRSPLGRSFPVAIATGGRGGDRWLQPRPLGLGGGATQISLKQPHVRCNYTNPTASGYQ